MAPVTLTINVLKSCVHIAGVEQCVLNLDYKGEIRIIMLYVDDCFVDCHNSEALDYVERKIIEIYGAIVQ